MVSQQSWPASHPPERDERDSQRILSHLTPVCRVSDLPVDMENEVLWEAAFGKAALSQSDQEFQSTPWWNEQVVRGCQAEALRKAKQGRSWTWEG